MMAENGENTGERPMWAEKGGLDFDGRARWDAWTALKGMKPDRAKLEFVRVRPRFMCCGQEYASPIRCLEYSQLKVQWGRAFTALYSSAGCPSNVLA